MGKVFDVVVIGGGPAGYVAAIRAGQLGLSVACAEGNPYADPKGEPRLGGTCLNVGCIPSKALLQSSENYHLLHDGFGQHGISVKDATIDIATMLGRKDKIVTQFTSGIKGLFKKNKVTFLPGHGKFVAAGGAGWQLEVGGEAVEARHVIVATGSNARKLPGVPVDNEVIVDNVGALEFKTVPKTLGIIGLGRFIPSRRDGRDVMIPVEEYRHEMIQRVLREAGNLDEFRQLWIESQDRRKLIEHLQGDNLSPDLLRDFERMTDYDNYDLFAHHGYHARALKRPERKVVYLTGNEAWFASLDPKAATVLKGLGHQFEVGGTEALETPTLWEVPEIKAAGGLDALRTIGTPVAVMKDAKTRLFAA